MDIVVPSYIGLAGLLFVMCIFHSCSFGILLWNWLSAIGFAVSPFAFSYLCDLEYKKTIEMRCYNNTDEFGCGGLRATFFKSLYYLFIGVGAFLSFASFFMIRKVILWLNSRSIEQS